MYLDVPSLLISNKLDLEEGLQLPQHFLLLIHRPEGERLVLSAEHLQRVLCRMGPMSQYKKIEKPVFW